MIALNGTPKPVHSARSQCEMILSHLRTRGSITPLEALNLYGCFRLGARVYDLRARGYNIESSLVKTGKRKFVSEYTLKEN